MVTMEGTRTTMDLMRDKTAVLGTAALPASLAAYCLVAWTGCCKGWALLSTTHCCSRSLCRCFQGGGWVLGGC